MINAFYHTIPLTKDYFKPDTIEEAVALLSRYSEEAKILAGGTDLLVSMRSRAIMPKYIVDITGIQDLGGIKFDDEKGLNIGATTTIRAVELSKIVQEKYLLLYEAAYQMGTTQVCNMATVGGNVCRASPSGDMAVCLLALGADLKIVSSTKTRTVALEKFSLGSNQTVLSSDEMVTEIYMPRLPENTGTSFLRATRVASDLAKVNVATVITLKGGVCTDVKIVLGAVTSTIMRAYEAEELIKGREIDDSLVERSAQAASDAVNPRPGSLRASPWYKKQIAEVLTKRAIIKSIERSQRQNRS